MSNIEEPSKENQTRTTRETYSRRLKVLSQVLRILIQVLRIVAIIFDIPFIDKGGSGSLDNYYFLRTKYSAKESLCS
ncbi:hypothetical protein BM525_17690 [Alteromonas mediterranea]|nr:hypothetical protein BM525_17690 [Alteromonas mediterranea]